MTSSYRIVAGVDGSEGGIRALRWAFRQAAAHGGTVHAVTCWQWNSTQAAQAGYAERLRAECEHILSTAISAALGDNPRVTVVGRVLIERPAHGLTTEAEGADLLVVGSHGHSRVRHAVVGSVAEACVRLASCPVVIVPVPAVVPEGTPLPVAAPALTAPVPEAR
jgi:nucleotide-binding universal stress UspA family protein